MKKTIKTMLALMAGTMALTACSNDAILENNNPQQPEQVEVARKHITFNAIQEGNVTRAAIDGTNIVWSQNDNITVLYRNENTLFGFDNATFSLTDGANTNSGTFDGEVLEDVTSETVYTALYPCYAKNEGTIEVTWEDLTEEEQMFYRDACMYDGSFDRVWFDDIRERNIVTQEQYDRILAYVNETNYTFNNSVTLTAEGKVTGVVFPAVQTATEGSFDPAAGLMMAQVVGETSKLAFKNVASYFKFVAPFDCSSVSINDNASAGQMAGTVTLNYNDGNPTAEMPTNGTSDSQHGENDTNTTTPTATKNGASSITLTGTIEAGKTYYIATLPQTFSQGITMCFTKTDGTEYEKSTSSSYTLGRNMVADMGTPVLDDANIVTAPYVTFSAENSQTLKMSQEVEGLQYSVGGGAWTLLGTSTVTFGGAAGDLRLRGTNGWGTVRSSTSQNTIHFGNDTPVACTGDIRTLVDYRNYETASTANARFAYLFQGCEQLTSAPALPATDLATGCYQDMFSYCFSLEVAPALPATTLAENCYSGMFYYCSNLTTAPELPATTLAEDCYYCMFCYCSNLTTAPELPATDLATRCYQNMFSNCSSLEVAPALPATTLAESCYTGMFNGCTSLATAPALPATELEPYCYNGMFCGCTSLTTAPELPATKLAWGCYNAMFQRCTNLNYVKAAFTTTPSISYTRDWLDGVAATGTFVKNPNATWDVTGASGVPTGWTVETPQGEGYDDGDTSGWY